MPASFTKIVRDELAHVEQRKPCCRLAETSALVRTTGSFHIRGGETEEERYGLHLSTTVQPAARRAYSHFKRFGAEGRLYTRRETRLHRRLIYEVHLPGSPPVLQALNELGVISDSFRLVSGVPWRLLRRTCCKAAFIRGCLIGAGSVNRPRQEAHLEILTPHGDFAADLVQLLEGLDFNTGSYVRRGVNVVYLKGRQQVAQLLALAGAQEAALELEEEAVVRDVRARANRLANWDEANLRRTSVAALRQLEAISALEERGRLASLPPALQEAAELRRLHPYHSLTDLAAERPDLSRSALNHRLRRLVQEAEKEGDRAGGERPSW